jgi:hypothetical protein
MEGIPFLAASSRVFWLDAPEKVFVTTNIYDIAAEGRRVDLNECPEYLSE